MGRDEDQGAFLVDAVLVGEGEVLGLLIGAFDFVEFRDWRH